MAVPYDQQGDIRPFATAVVRASARPVDLGRLGTKTLKARASKARRLDEEAITTRAGERRGSMLAKAAAPDPSTAPTQGSSGGGQDIEDLLKTLTPRLRQISEAQNLEYRQGSPTEVALNCGTKPGSKLQSSNSLQPRRRVTAAKASEAKMKQSAANSMQRSGSAPNLQKKKTGSDLVASEEVGTGEVKEADKLPDIHQKPGTPPDGTKATANGNSKPSPKAAAGTPP
eukprot:s205_g13.t1